jgi:hypothetical protein
MVESICGQGFAYAHEVEKDRQRSSQTRSRKGYRKDTIAAARAEQIHHNARCGPSLLYA